jgi:predicted deacylase
MASKRRRTSQTLKATSQVQAARSDARVSSPTAVDSSLVTASIDLGNDGLHFGHLSVPYSHDGSAYGHIRIPLVVAQRGAGPTALLTGGVHGDEYEGPLALARLMHALPIAHLHGRIIAIPALNYPAFLAGTRTSPIDRLNLNRRFPGDRNGMPTDMIAHYVETVLMPLADYCFDFHSGGASLSYLPALIVDRPRDEAQHAITERLVEAFRPPRVLFMDMLGEDRLIGAAASRHGVHFVTGEFGGAAGVSADGIELVASGVAAMLEAVGILDSAVAQAARRMCAPSRRMSVNGPEHYLFAPCAGLFEPRFALGDDISAGALAGYIHDPEALWEPPQEIHFAGNGTVVCLRTHARVVPGDCLAHLASDAT